MTIKAVARGCAAGFVVAVTVTACTSTSNGSGSGSAAPAQQTPKASARSRTTTAPTTAPKTAPTTSSRPKPARSSPSPSGGSAAAAPPGGPVPAKFVPVSATFVSADDAWVLGTAPCPHKPCTSIVRTRDGGRSWQGIPAPRASEGDARTGQTGEVSTLRFADQLDGWAGVGELYSTHDGGASWHKQSVDGQVSHIETGGGYVFVTTDTCVRPREDCSSRVYASPVGRDAWRTVATRLATQNGVASLVVHDADWFAGSTTGVYHGDGASSTIDRLPNPCPRADGEYGSPQIAAADLQHLDAACVSGGAAGSAQYELFGSTDGGRDWRKSRTFTGASGLEGIADNGHGVLMLAESSAVSAVERSTNDGKSFKTSRVDSAHGGAPWADLGFTTPSQAVVVLDRVGTYLSHDAGTTFTRVRF